jgi:hypothetical protein
MTDASPSSRSRAPAVRIFLSSPGDVAAEREKARQVVAALQRHYGEEVRLETVLWEDLPRIQRADIDHLRQSRDGFGYR